MRKKSKRDDQRASHKIKEELFNSFIENPERSDLKKSFNKFVNTEMKRRNAPKGLAPRGENQKQYLSTLASQSGHITFGIGPAGTGKTLLATQYAIQEFCAGNIEKIVITRPAVSVDEQWGFLPGTLEEKAAPWVMPILDIFAEHFTQAEIEAMMYNKEIAIEPLAYMRGRTFKNCIVIADEMQNSTPDQMKMILTRIGTNCKMIVTGDLEQHDRTYAKNGLGDFIARVEKSEHNPSINVCRFNQSDIQRHPVIEAVLNLYDKKND